MDERDQQLESIDMLEQHRETLAAEARAILLKHSGAKMVGMALSADSSEAALFREMAVGQAPPPTSGVVVVVPRKLALSILRAHAPATLDWLESEPGVLPLVAATKDGMRLSSVSLEI